MLRQRMDSFVDVVGCGRRGHQVGAAVVGDGDGPPPGDGRETDETGTDPNEGDETSGPFGRHPTRISERVRYGLKKRKDPITYRVEEEFRLDLKFLNKLLQIVMYWLKVLFSFLFLPTFPPVISGRMINVRNNQDRSRR